MAKRERALALAVTTVLLFCVPAALAASTLPSRSRTTTTKTSAIHRAPSSPNVAAAAAAPAQWD